ncbi:MAG: type II secretion system protein N [Candidatus Competibacteraceae bacterium]|nr:type II secretion system protein N [Candidatus Competibacteraceae bacterium]
MKSIWGYGLLGLAAFLIFLGLLAPATLLVDQFSRRLSGFSAQTVAGSAARGSMSAIDWHGVRIERLSWRWRPQGLLSGRLEFDLKADDPQMLLAGNAGFGFNRRLQFRQLSGQLPVEWLSRAVSGKLPLDGIAEFKLPALDLDAAGQPLAAQGVVQFLNLRASLGQPVNLGDYRLQLEPAGADGISGQIKDANAPLALEGTLNLAPDGRYRLNGHVALRETGNAALRQALNLLGPPGGDGRWALNFTGALAR